MCLQLWAPKNAYLFHIVNVHLFHLTLLQCHSHWCKYPQRDFFDGETQFNSLFPSSDNSDDILCPSLFSHALCYIRGFHPPCRQSSPNGFPLRLWYWTLTSTKAGTVCQHDAPCRPAAPEVRNKENITACAALKKTNRSTVPAHQRSESSNNECVTRLSCQFLLPAHKAWSLTWRAVVQSSISENPSVPLELRISPHVEVVCMLM